MIETFHKLFFNMHLHLFLWYLLIEKLEKREKMIWGKTKRESRKAVLRNVVKSLYFSGGKFFRE